MKIEWQKQAEAELEAAFDFYLLNAGAEVARAFRNEVGRVTERLGQHPNIGIRIHHRCRRFPLHGYPYDLIYRVTPATLIVVALAHQRRRPGYWAGR